MYLCIGTLLKLIDLYKNDGYTKIELCQELFAFAEYEYNKSDASELINCNSNIKIRDRNDIIIITFKMISNIIDYTNYWKAMQTLFCVMYYQSIISGHLYNPY